MKNESYDVAVVGSGPSGATAAYWCARKGLKTCILEKEQLPREKPCGGAVSKKALSYLPFSVPESILQRGVSGFTLYISDHDPFAVDFGEALGYLTLRKEFDPNYGKCKDKRKDIYWNICKYLVKDTIMKCNLNKRPCPAWKWYAHDVSQATHL